MPLSKLVFKPGINKDQTNYASEGGWYEMDKVRFRSGFPEKMGGWVVGTVQQFVGTAKSLFTWATDTGGALLGIGTDKKMYVSVGSNLVDITPIRVTYTHATSPSTDNCFATSIGLNTVTVTLNLHGASNGGYVTFSGVASSVGGIPASDFNKEFVISNVTLNTFTITTTTSATSTVAAGGGTAITAAFQISIGYDESTFGYGWGTGTYSRLSWGSGTYTPVSYPSRAINQDHFNNDLVFNIADSYIYYWVYDAGFTTRAVLLSSLSGAVAVPQQVKLCMFAPSGHLLALACTNYDAGASAPDYLGTYDPLLIRWANVDADVGPEPEKWQPTVTNTAGFLRLKSGTGIVTALATRQEILVWTDISVSSLQFLGTSEVFGLQELSAHITVMGPNTVAGANNVVYWMGTDKFYSYSGRVDTLPCTVRQYVFSDVNRTQSDSFFAGTNNQFNEIIWFYCSASSNTVNRYVIYNYAENIWYYGQLNRTAWVDAGVNQYPLATADGWVYMHENGHDDGQPLGAPSLPITSYIQSADVDIDDGDKFMLIRRVVPDVNFTSSNTTDPVTGVALTPQAEITVGVRNFPGASNATTNASGITTTRDVITTTATIDQYTNQVFIRARGRQMNFKIFSDTLGTQWQLGMPRVDARPDGMRG